MVEELRRYWAGLLGLLEQAKYLLDTKPVPVVGYKRRKRHSDFSGSADYGFCASRNMKYFGYKLVMISTLDGIPVAYELVPANTDERVAADAVLPHVWHSDIFADKGFIGEEWQAEHLILRAIVFGHPNESTKSFRIRSSLTDGSMHCENALKVLSTNSRTPDAILNVCCAKQSRAVSPM